MLIVFGVVGLIFVLLIALSVVLSIWREFLPEGHPGRPRDPAITKAEARRTDKPNPDHPDQEDDWTDFNQAQGREPFEGP
jgi:hypothetical protein